MTTLFRPLSIFLAFASPAFAGTRLTCNPDELRPDSYRWTTRGVALAVNEERGNTWASTDLLRVSNDLDDLNRGVTGAAERALELDPRNLMAHAVIARQALIDLEPERAAAAWSTVFAAGGAVTWTGTLYDVDARNYFLLAFDGRGLRVYRFEQLARRVDRGFGGVIRLPPADDEPFWAAASGCVDRAIAPEAYVEWSDVREIKAGNHVLWFKLKRRIAIHSDRNHKRKELDEIKVALHGVMPGFEVVKPVGESELAVRGRGSAGFQDLVRRTLVELVDPEQRITLPPLRPGVGW